MVYVNKVRLVRFGVFVKQVQIWLDFGLGAFDRNLRNKMVTSVDFVDLLRINGY